MQQNYDYMHTNGLSNFHVTNSNVEAWWVDHDVGLMIHAVHGPRDNSTGCVPYLPQNMFPLEELGPNKALVQECYGIPNQASEQRLWEIIFDLSSHLEGLALEIMQCLLWNFAT